MAAQSKELLPSWGGAVAGASGAVLANALVYPLDIVKTRLQVQEDVKSTTANKNVAEKRNRHYKSTWDAVYSIVENEGIEGLYAGMLGSLIGVASTNFAYFYWYDVVRSTLYHSSRDPAPLGTAVELSLGAAAGALAQLFTIPVAVVTTRQQTQLQGEKKGLLQTAEEVVRGEDGWTGLWRGFKASLLLVVNPAITYGAFSRLRELGFQGRLNLRPWETFLSTAG